MGAPESADSTASRSAGESTVMNSATLCPSSSAAWAGLSAATLDRVWYMISIASFFTLANTRRPSSPGTAFSFAKPSWPVQNARQGSTASTISTGARER